MKKEEIKMNPLQKATMAEEMEINGDKISTIDQKFMPPIILPDPKTGEPASFRILDGEYVPENEALVIFQERKVEAEQHKLDMLKKRLINKE